MFTVVMVQVFEVVQLASTFRRNQIWKWSTIFPLRRKFIIIFIHTQLKIQVYGICVYMFDMTSMQNTNISDDIYSVMMSMQIDTLV